jgi:hypothetical protein
MSQSIETVIVNTENGPVIINKCDFDETVHLLYEGEESVPKEVLFDRKAARDYLNTLGVQTAKNISNEELAKLVEETKVKMAGV